ncbi:tyrosine-type recombinase/integrase [Pseudoalteromonas sp. P1-8]|uniref:tyrosine-type recombinase/integrase n=1 Tax=Pseudoalteromonas sp. P1-8 TaxID=1710353 RepID=UPI0006DBE972|nr:tyrosine-type recombinase/integrase [Pseudoalteromonas sp. P1-8]KPV99028.1 Tyrosine recombinase XerC [Pseudoalteromonas sp. P1-8]
MRVVQVKGIKYAGGEINLSTVVDDKDIPLFAPSLFLLHVARNGRISDNKATTKAYAQVLKDFFDVLKASDDLSYADVTDAHMTAYLNAYRGQKKGNKKSTIEYHATVLSKFYSYMKKIGITDAFDYLSFTYDNSETQRNVKDLLMGEILTIYMDENEFEDKILAQVKAQNPFIRERDELALKLGYYAGFRTHELVSHNNLSTAILRRKFPEKDKHLIRADELEIIGKGNKVRKAHISPKLVSAINNFLWGRGKNLKESLMAKANGESLSDLNYASRLFTRIKLANLAETNSDKDAWKARVYHSLRKCYATNSVGFCYDENKDPMVFVPQWLGHSSVETTKIYIFYDFVITNRFGVVDTLSLKNTAYAKKYFGKSR